MLDLAYLSRSAGQRGPLTGTPPASGGSREQCVEVSGNQEGVPEDPRPGCFCVPATSPFFLQGRRRRPERSTSTVTKIILLGERMN